MVLHAVDVRLQPTISGPDDRLHARSKSDVVEAALDGVDGGLVALRRFGVDVDTDDVVGPIDGAQQTYELVRVAVRQNVIRDRKVSRFRVYHVDEPASTAEGGTVGGLVQNIFVACRSPGHIARCEVGGQIV